ncbi:hypothetical protein scyTo_0005093 [Scyliorhinus torazame]|uniref:Integrase catalytic domain-containing protein n=1 Tax=Scyliorhinus torazame TaxID=75743 RepID=A0A401P265_SCYTO|nr:hypothetical protein [Scyliorhinus torazame]
MCTDKGIKLEHSTPLHPQSSGSVERRNQDVKLCMTKLLMTRGRSWAKLVPEVQLAVNNLPLSRVEPEEHITPYFLMFQVQLNTAQQAPEGVIPQYNPELAQEMIGLLSQMQPPKLPEPNEWSPQEGDWVQEKKNPRNTLLRPKWKPPVCVKQVQGRTLLVDHGTKGIKLISIDNCQPVPKAFESQVNNTMTRWYARYEVRSHNEPELDEPPEEIPRTQVITTPGKTCLKGHPQRLKFKAKVQKIIRSQKRWSNKQKPQCCCLTALGITFSLVLFSLILGTITVSLIAT